MKTNFVPPVWLLAACIFHAVIVPHFYWSWRQTCLNPGKFRALKFLFIKDRAVLAKTYDLEDAAVDVFLKKSRRTLILLVSFIVILQPVVGFFCLRAFLEYYGKLPLYLNWCVAVPCAVVTMITYFCLTYTGNVLYIFLFTTQQFLVARAKSLAVKVKKLGNYFDKHIDRDLREIEILEGFLQKDLDEETKRLFTGRINEINGWYGKKTLKMSKSLFGLWEQYEETREFFDTKLTLHYLNVLFCGFLYPLYFYFELDFLSRVGAIQFLTRPTTNSHVLPPVPDLRDHVVRVRFVADRFRSDGGQWHLHARGG